MIPSPQSLWPCPWAGKAPAAFVRSDWITKLLTERHAVKLHTRETDSWHFACPSLNSVLNINLTQVHQNGGNPKFNPDRGQRHLGNVVLPFQILQCRKVHKKEVVDKNGCWTAKVQHPPQIYMLLLLLVTMTCAWSDHEMRSCVWSS